MGEEQKIDDKEKKRDSSDYVFQKGLISLSKISSMVKLQINPKRLSADVSVWNQPAPKLCPFLYFQRFLLFLSANT